MKLTGPHLALMYVTKGRWHLVVTPLSTVTYSPDDSESSPTRVLAQRDLGPAESPLAPIIDPVERGKPGTVNGWSKGERPDEWRTVCYPTGDVLGEPSS
ncbi:hypothetical protein [Streptomyces mexicanus]|uniref:hypothetical protein n=1 Tax=Streptomyces mexicanus TaxID=178566 RepID=UPI00365C02D6